MGSRGGVIVIDPIIPIIVGALFFVLPGVIIIAYGAMLIANRPRRLPWGGNRLRFAYQLAEWYEKGTFQTEAQFEEIWLQLRSLSGWALLGGGLGWLLSACALFIGFATAPGVVRGVLWGSWLLQFMFVECVTFGITLGYQVGSARATHRAPHAPTYGDVRPRRSSDYFAGWLLWVPVCVSAYACATVALLASQVDYARLGYSESLWILPTRIILAVFVATALVVNGIGLASIRWIAVSPRTLLSSNTQAARGADDFRRATEIGSILQMTWMSSAYVLMAATSIVTSPGALVGHTSAFTPLLHAMGINFLLAMPIYIFGGFLAAFQGRLGGTLTGWRNPFRQLGPVPAR